MRHLSELIIDTTIQTSKQSPKVISFLSAAMAVVLPRVRARQTSAVLVPSSGEKGHAPCDDYYCELC